MVRWFQAMAATGMWAFVLCGGVGLLEAASQWARFGRPDGLAEAGPIRLLVPALSLYGWFGLAAALAVALPVAAVLGRRPGARRLVFATGVAAAVGLLSAVYFGYVFHESDAGLWWSGTVGTALPLKLLVALGVTLLVLRPMRRLADALVSNPLRWLFLPVVIAVVATGLWPDWRDEARHRQTGHLARLEEAPPDGPDLVLVTIDTLRRDMVGRLSPDAPPTPNLDRLADEGLLYANAWSSSSWTLPSMGTLLTGLPPRSLGVSRWIGLPEAAGTLAESAWRAGWRTAAVVGNPFLGYDYGFQRGFEHFDHGVVLEPLAPAARSVLVRETTRYVVANSEPEDAATLVTRALRWLADEPGDRPVFLWIHLMDPHLPYRWRPLPGDEEPPTLPDDAAFADGMFNDLDGLRAAAPSPDPDYLQAVTDLYRREVRYADHWVGRLTDGLRESGRLDRTLLAVTSDHGEEFFEHGGFEHGHSLLPEVTGVPLIVRLPGGRLAGTVVADAAVAQDVLPSLCRELGWRAPEGAPGAASLWPAVDGDSEPATDLTVLENMLYGGDDQAWLRWPDFHHAPDGEASAWFDLSRDPSAMAAATAPADVDTLRVRVRDLLNEWDEHAAQIGAAGREAEEISEAVRRRLESLGY